MAVCEFDKLFTRSVPHILERIFFSLDYVSFTACRDVCKAWSELHASEVYRQKREELLGELLGGKKAAARTGLYLDKSVVHPMTPQASSALFVGWRFAERTHSES